MSMQAKHCLISNMATWGMDKAVQRCNKQLAMLGQTSTQACSSSKAQLMCHRPLPSKVQPVSGISSRLTSSHGSERLEQLDLVVEGLGIAGHVDHLIQVIIVLTPYIWR